MQGLRPFGVSFIYAGYDSQREFQLYQSNPSGNYGGWKATSVGANNASAQSLLKQDYKEDCDLEEACAIAVKILSKTMDSTTLSSEKSTSSFLNYSLIFTLHAFHEYGINVSCVTVEFATLGRTADGGIYHHLWTAPEITDLLKKHGLAKAEEEK